jgi:hypothetical protein
MGPAWISIAGAKIHGGASLGWGFMIAPRAGRGKSPAAAIFPLPEKVNFQAISRITHSLGET